MVKDYIFHKKNGYKISGKMFMPDGAAKRCPVVIFSHGFGSNYRELMHHGVGFSEAGIACFFFDFCGGGPESLSDGTMREMTVETECGDLNTVLDEIKKLEYIEPSQIFLIGESMGGLVTALVAAKRQSEIQAIILWYPAFNIPDDVMKREKTNKNTIFGLPLSWDYDEVALEISPYQVLGGYKSPVLLVHGDKDPVVPLVYSKRAVEVLPCGELYVIEGGEHGFCGEDADLAREVSIEFIKKSALEFIKKRAFLIVFAL